MKKGLIITLLLVSNIFIFEPLISEEIVEDKNLIEKVSFDNLPVLYQIGSKDTFKQFGNALSEMAKNKIAPYSRELKFEMEYKSTPAISWYIVNPTIEKDSIELSEEDIGTNKVFNEYILTHNDMVRQKASEASKKINDAEVVLDAEEFINVDA